MPGLALSLANAFVVSFRAGGLGLRGSAIARVHRRAVCGGTERALKALSRAGELARYRVIHFATHGLMSGESEAILKAKAEQALILTPPKDGTRLPMSCRKMMACSRPPKVAQLNLRGAIGTGPRLLLRPRHGRW
jgi:hypothetical protein